MTQNEQAIRREAQRHGYMLIKSRYRNPDRIGYGRYMLVDAATNINVLSPQLPDFSATLDDVANFLSH